MSEIIRNYQIENELGHGAFGVTYRGIDITTNHIVAIKTINLSAQNSAGISIDSVMEEVDHLREITADECNRYIACYIDSFIHTFRGNPTLFIISEYIDGMTLYDFMIKYNVINDPRILWPIYLQLILGLKYIHSRNYAHRDIKLENIMITNEFLIKYIDFGISCNDTCGGIGGTSLYMPPEMYRENSPNSLKASKAHDVWSLAIVMFNLAHGPNIFPFDTSNTKNIALAPQYAPDYNFDDGRTNEFLLYLLVNDWVSRPVIREILDYYTDNISTIPFF